MAKATITLQAKVAWWVNPYIQSVSLFAWLMQVEPDYEKVAKFACKGIKFKVRGGAGQKSGI